MSNSEVTKMIHLKIGEVIITYKSSIIRTVLGSCVSVTMFVPATKLAMISHSIYSGEGDTGNLHYTINSIQRMDREINRNSISKRDVIVKLFGGGLQLISSESRETKDVQSDNVKCAIDELKRLGYHISTGNVGGYYSREVRFHTENGDVFLKRSKV